MSAFRNGWEIEELVQAVERRRDPALLPYARFLRDWVACVNRSTDGWAYWKAGSDAGGKLADLLDKALGPEKVSQAEWNKAIGGIKRAASGQKKYGNNVPVPVLQENG